MIKMKIKQILITAMLLGALTTLNPTNYVQAAEINEVESREQAVYDEDVLKDLTESVREICLALNMVSDGSTDYEKTLKLATTSCERVKALKIEEVKKIPNGYRYYEWIIKSYEDISTKIKQEKELAEKAKFENLSKQFDKALEDMTNALYDLEHGSTDYEKILKLANSSVEVAKSLTKEDINKIESGQIKCQWVINTYPSIVDGVEKTKAQREKDSIEKVTKTLDEAKANIQSVSKELEEGENRYDVLLMDVKTSLEKVKSLSKQDIKKVKYGELKYKWISDVSNGLIKKLEKNNQLQKALNKAKKASDDFSSGSTEYDKILNLAKEATEDVKLLNDEDLKKMNFGVENKQIIIDTYSDLSVKVEKSKQLDKHLKEMETALYDLEHGSKDFDRILKLATDSRDGIKLLNEEDIKKIPFGDTKSQWIRNTYNSIIDRVEKAKQNLAKDIVERVTKTLDGAKATIQSVSKEFEEGESRYDILLMDVKTSLEKVNSLSKEDIKKIKDAEAKYKWIIDESNGLIEKLEKNNLVQKASKKAEKAWEDLNTGSTEYEKILSLAKEATEDIKVLSDEELEKINFGVENKQIIMDTYSDLIVKIEKVKQFDKYLKDMETALYDLDHGSKDFDKILKLATASKDSAKLLSEEEINKIPFGNVKNQWIINTYTSIVDRVEKAKAENEKYRLSEAKRILQKADKVIQALSKELEAGQKDYDRMLQSVREVMHDVRGLSKEDIKKLENGQALYDWAIDSESDISRKIQREQEKEIPEVQVM